MAATQARRGFTILRGRSDIGRHEVLLTRDGPDLRAEIDIEIVVRILGIAAYRYEMTNREHWRDGMLQSIDSRVNDDGRRKQVRAERGADGLMVRSDFYEGPAPAEAASTTYFTPAFLARDVWISTDSGELYDIAVTGLGEAPVRTKRGEVFCRGHRAQGGEDFDVRLFYDERGEWASVEFDASGEPARYVADDLDDSLTAVWNG